MQNLNLVHSLKAKHNANFGYHTIGQNHHKKDNLFYPAIKGQKHVQNGGNRNTYKNEG